MKIRCINNQRSLIPEKYLNIYSSSETLHLELGDEYVVYAFSDFDGFSWFCISEDSAFSWPTWYPFFLFEIVDQRLSRFWIFKFVEHIGISSIFDRPLFSFPEFVNDKYFLYDLIDGEFSEDGGKKAKEIFKAYKQLMDLEFPDSSVKEIAQIGDEKWLICPSCMDAWEDSNPRNAMVICPNCKTVQHNPRYKNELPSYAGD